MPIAEYQAIFSPRLIMSPILCFFVLSGFLAGLVVLVSLISLILEIVLFLSTSLLCFLLLVACYSAVKSYLFQGDSVLICKSQHSEALVYFGYDGDLCPLPLDIAESCHKFCRSNEKPLIGSTSQFTEFCI